MLITHDIGVIAETADRVAVMYAGRIAELGPVAEIVRPAHPLHEGADREHPLAGTPGRAAGADRRGDAATGPIRAAAPSSALPAGLRSLPGRAPEFDARRSHRRRLLAQRRPARPSDAAAADA